LQERIRKCASCWKSARLIWTAHWRIDIAEGNLQKEMAPRIKLKLEGEEREKAEKEKEGEITGKGKLTAKSFDLSKDIV